MQLYYTLHHPIQTHPLTPCHIHTRICIYGDVERQVNRTRRVKRCLTEMKTRIKVSAMPRQAMHCKGAEYDENRQRMAHLLP